MGPVGLQCPKHLVDRCLMRLAIDQKEFQGVFAKGETDGRPPIGVALGRVGGLRQELMRFPVCLPHGGLGGAQP